VKSGGSAHIQYIYDYIRYGIEFNDYDLSYLEGPVSEPVWKNQARNVAIDLRKEGLLERSRRHGVWEITEKGRAIVELG
jgi:hypothetical protein